ncbi:MAG: glycosyltransferase family 9 protein [Ignavibacteria bacterium]|nr:glycosyltransferase family 9 protein [Ignavibacteria bacterium]MDP3832063.1 glycosyltransferase family 9 protein [Ignavibacteriaceae bacterium]
MIRILIVRPDRVGDVTTVTPVLREIRKKFPTVFIATLTKPNTAAILYNNPNINLVLTDDQSKENFWSTVKELRKHKFTHGFILWPNERAAYLLYFSGIKVRVGVGHKLFQMITGMKSVSRNKYIPLRHEADYSMDFARKLGVVTENLQPEIFLTDNEIKEAEQFYEDKGILPHEKILIIHTGSLNSAPNWSELKYLTFIKDILNDNNFNHLKIFLTAREMSKEFINDATALSTRVINIVEETEDLRTLIKVIYKTGSLLSSSTGPLHIASALNVNCIGLYCCEPMRCVKRWGAISPKAVNLEVSAEYCSQNCPADQSQCAFENGISIELVKEVLLRQITLLTI